MKAKVTQRGVTVPRRMLGEADEVEIRAEGGRVVVTPLPEHDPIFGLGDEPVTTGVVDAAESHDRYLYSPGR